MVEILTDPNRHPNKDWLEFTITSRARSKIRSYLRNEQRESALKLGRDLLERALHSAGLSFAKVLKTNALGRALEDAKLQSVDELIIQVGYGRYSADAVVRSLVLVAPEGHAAADMEQGALVRGMGNGTRARLHPGPGRRREQHPRAGPLPVVLFAAAWRPDRRVLAAPAGPRRLAAPPLPEASTSTPTAASRWLGRGGERGPGRCACGSSRPTASGLLARWGTTFSKCGVNIEEGQLPRRRGGARGQPLHLHPHRPRLAQGRDARPAEGEGCPLRRAHLSDARRRRVTLRPLCFPFACAAVSWGCADGPRPLARTDAGVRADVEGRIDAPPPDAPSRCAAGVIYCQGDTQYACDAEGNVVDRHACAAPRPRSACRGGLPRLQPWIVALRTLRCRGRRAAASPTDRATPKARSATPRARTCNAGGVRRPLLRQRPGQLVPWLRLLADGDAQRGAQPGLPVRGGAHQPADLPGARDHHRRLARRASHHGDGPRRGGDGGPPVVGLRAGQAALHPDRRGPASPGTPPSPPSAAAARTTCTPTDPSRPTSSTR